MPRSQSRPPVGLAALVLLIVVGTALALWFYVRGPVASSVLPAPQTLEGSPMLEDEAAPEHDAALDGHGLTRHSGDGLARSGG